MMTRRLHAYDQANQEYREFKADVNNKIEKFGRALIGVIDADRRRLAASDPNAHFLYSIGNKQALGYPELLVLGHGGEHTARLINTLSNKMRDNGRRFRDGEMVELGGSTPLCVVVATDEAKEQYTLFASAYYGEEDYDLMQVVVPDPQGRFPWHRDCAAPFRDVKVFRKLQG